MLIQLWKADGLFGKPIQVWRLKIFQPLWTVASEVIATERITDSQSD